MFCPVLTLFSPIGCSLRVVSFSCLSKAGPAHSILRSILFVSIPSIHHYARAPHSTFYRLFSFLCLTDGVQFNSIAAPNTPSVCSNLKLQNFRSKALCLDEKSNFLAPINMQWVLEDGEPCIFIILIIIITIIRQYHLILYSFFNILYDSSKNQHLDSKTSFLFLDQNYFNTNIFERSNESVICKCTWLRLFYV